MKPPSAGPPLAPWPFLCGLPVRFIPDGLINETWCVGDPPVSVVQRVGPMYTAELHGDIEAITEHVASKGVLTPRLLRTGEGGLCHVADDGGVWRAMNWIPGKSPHRMEGPAMAAEAGHLVARWHAALDDLEHTFAFVRPEAHDTPLQLQFMEGALQAWPEHRLRGPVSSLAEEVLSRWEDWEGTLEAPRRISHGDLKISNLRFSEAGEALCLLDLDTLGMLSLDVELGDAWRSWCNVSDENSEEACFDLSLFGASAQAYLAQRPLERELLERLPAGVERICLELAARFAADALNERYFGWNPEVAPTWGDHNLLRARGQLALGRHVRSQRLEMERILLH